jgi:hypothetical protein
VKSVPLIGWAGLSNGKLLAPAQDQFDVLITMDGSMASQQNLGSFRIALIARCGRDRIVSKIQVR